MALAADRGGVLERLLGEGPVFLDRDTTRCPLGGRRLPYLIESNSAAADFLCAVDPAGASPTADSRVKQREETTCEQGRTAAGR
ncbi:hypothetical protein [Streptomyces malaysiensis]|uniref:hypothetical protein n=1 Tax=Streptomyces malaysiensis TaxID=92644 RepID=UPI00322093F2|nr:hypothetical protein [Streptomyces malaysiensis]